MRTIETVKEREPFFVGADTNNAFSKIQCGRCDAEHDIGFGQILHAAWGWREELNSDLVMRLANEFEIDLSIKSIESGMDAVVSLQCTCCDSLYYICFWFDEYRHSCYSISLRGVVEENT